MAVILIVEPKIVFADMALLVDVATLWCRPERGIVLELPRSTASCWLKNVDAE